MNVENERSRSFWMDVDRPEARRLGSNLSIDVLVIGGGIAGLSTAYELVQRGHEVAVVDRGAIGGGMTARTSAHLAYETDDLYSKLIGAVGEDSARTYFESQRAAVDRIEAICAEHKIACDFARVDLYVFAPDHRGRRKLDDEIDAAARIGFKTIEWADAPVEGMTRGCLRFPHQARFHPLRYLSGLSRALSRDGAKLYANTPVISVEERARDVIAETGNGHRIVARSVVAATNSPFVNRLAVHMKQAPYRTYIIAARVPKRSVVDALIWDTDDPYHYVRVQPRAKDDLLIVGGEDHKTGTADDADKRLERLETWARSRFPQLVSVENAWSGQVYEPSDFMPFIGRSPGYKRTFIVTGDSGSGLTTGVAASLILPDLIEGKKNPWAKAYSPARKVKAPSPIADFVKEQVSAAKHLIAHVTGGDKPEEIARGRGALIRVKGKNHAAYRDSDGELHVMKAACTHAGCEVKWNSFEECWDCPCHGSHFAPLGEPLQCPAVKPLETANAVLAESTPAARPKSRKVEEHASRRRG